MKKYATTCRSCGKASSSGLCPDCRYRNGGPMKDQFEDSTVDMVTHMRKPFRLRVSGLRHFLPME